ncbi:hypothetical protein NLX86_12180 [Streptomyces sp. A3M-1-3]|uniref:hypothetical protein n=1 Tax=Streptomyces sp. A3M-1-3 TaxID=2962044 RepID=UPI0020B82F63|nr:hypothetical protein [Streptomyces sp. A3M-1-3]MCP3818839.1 hypothetical protein [Streptomyces sp. A3M-1-3]
MSLTPVHTSSRPSRRKPDRSAGGWAAGFGRLLTTARGAGPVLLAAGALAGVGAVLSIAWAVDAGVVLAVAAVVTVLVRRRLQSDASCAHDQRDRRRRRCC